MTILEQSPIYREILAEGVALGREEGRLEGRQEGRQEGRREGLEQSIMQVLTQRLGAVPTEVQARLSHLSGRQNWKRCWTMSSWCRT